MSKPQGFVIGPLLNKLGVIRHSPQAVFLAISAHFRPQGLVRSRGLVPYFTILNDSVRKSLSANVLGSSHPALPEG